MSDEQQRHRLRDTHPDVWEALEIAALRYLHVKYKLTPRVAPKTLDELHRELMAFGLSPTQVDYDRQISFAAREAIWEWRISCALFHDNRWDGRALQRMREHGVMLVGDLLDLIARRLSPVIRDSLIAEAERFGTRQH